LHIKSEEFSQDLKEHLIVSIYLSLAMKILWVLDKWKKLTENNHYESKVQELKKLYQIALIPAKLFDTQKLLHLVYSNLYENS
jgi:hypothetical protein